MKRLIYHLGKRSKLIRAIYYKYSNHNWLWGIITYVSDNFIYDPNPVNPRDLYTASEWIEKHEKDIFK